MFLYPSRLELELLCLITTNICAPVLEKSVQVSVTHLKVSYKVMLPCNLCIYSFFIYTY